MIDSEQFRKELLEATKAKHGTVEIWSLMLLETAGASLDYAAALDTEMQSPNAKRQLWLRGQKALALLRVADCVRRLGLELRPGCNCQQPNPDLDPLNRELQEVAEEQRAKETE
ncbi:MAG: hypothetical protein L6306_12220 [Planctomycetales bacterium]|nr:hypothetical protein [Planctomycetales bacterium]